MKIRYWLMLWGVWALAWIVTGCGKQYSTAPTSEREDYIVSETARYADKLHVYVVGVVTDERNTYGCDASVDCHDFGWYWPGKAFYYRPDVNSEKYSMQLLSDVAAHEVCHSQSMLHDVKHWCCIHNLGANATYPAPIQGTPVCGDER